MGQIINLDCVRTKPYWTDYILAKVFLPLTPQWLRPNHLTILRFMLTPFVLWLLWTGDYKTGLVAFIAVAFTDAWDGMVARMRQQITIWGTVYDPVADKILIGGAVLILVIKHLGLPLALIIITLELLTIGGAFYFKLKGILCPAIIWGKIKMLLQVIATVVLLTGMIGNWPILFSVAYGIFIASIVFGFLSLIRRGA